MEGKGRLSLVIFDLDGTLVKLPIDYDKMYDRLRKLFGLEDRVVPLRTVDRLTRNNPLLRMRAFEILTEAELEALPRMRINPKLDELRKIFREVRKALVTMQGREVVDLILPRLGLRFSAIVTREQSMDRSEQLRKALEDLEVRPGEALFIGDRLNDEVSARKVGCRFMRAKW